jgi:1-deoxypentalenic acid 11beta-hydroxylase
MGELAVSNDLLGDRQALAAAWDRDGYWFFRGVLDAQVIAGIRQAYVEYLVEMGVADAGDPEARYNGADYTDLPINSNATRLNEHKVHRLLHEAPAINAFFARLFGCDPFWIPFTVHRTNPPVADRGRSRFDFIHNDGVYNDGLPFLICWVPLDDIDEEVGGIALIEGVHNGPTLHTREGMTINPIRLEDTPPDRWRRADYRAGDVLLMSLGTPHSGLSNISKDRFRFSMDTRIMPSDGKVPMVGTIRDVTAQGVTVIDAQGERRLRFDDRSFVRGHRGDQMPLADIPGRYQAGDDVIIAHDGDCVVNMRPQT